jgi:hypothetical protein
MSVVLTGDVHHWIPSADRAHVRRASRSLRSSTPGSRVVMAFE